MQKRDVDIQQRVFLKKDIDIPKKGIDIAEEEGGTPRKDKDILKTVSVRR